VGTGSTAWESTLNDWKWVIDVNLWGRSCETYLACMEILAHDRPFFLRDVWEIISDQGLNVSNVDVKVSRARDARISVCIDVENWLQFNTVLSRIEDLPGTIWVRRTTNPGPRGEQA